MTHNQNVSTSESECFNSFPEVVSVVCWLEEFSPTGSRELTDSKFEFGLRVRFLIDKRSLDNNRKKGQVRTYPLFVHHLIIAVADWTACAARTRFTNALHRLPQAPDSSVGHSFVFWHSLRIFEKSFSSRFTFKNRFHKWRRLRKQSRYGYSQFFSFY